MMNDLYAYQKMYYHLFNTYEDVVEKLEHVISITNGEVKAECQSILAYLIQKLNECENIFIDAEEQEITVLEEMELGWEEAFDQRDKMTYRDTEWLEMHQKHYSKSDEELSGDYSDEIGIYF